VAIAFACLAAQLHAADPSRWEVTAFALLFTGLSIAALWFRWGASGGLALLGLAGETVFFLIFAAYGASGTAWLGSLLYIHLLLVAVFVHHWWDACGVVGVCAGYLAVARGWGGALFSVVLWAGILAGVAARYRSETRQKLAKYLRLAQEATQTAAKARDAERQKLAGDFHDGPLQGFIGVHMRLAFLAKLLDRDVEAARRELRELQELTKSQIAEIRVLLRGLRPVEVGEAGLPASLRQAVAGFQKDSGIAATFQSSVPPGLLSEEASLEVIQIAREALHNIQKHSRATRVAVTVSRAGDSLELSIEDNGHGFPFAGDFDLDELERLHIGPLSIQRRIRALGGQLRVESRPPRGCGILVRVPV
jgi:signal transduction histidine kinase